MFSQKPSQLGKVKSGTHNQQVDGDEVDSYNNQYIKKPGFAYYRDLAGRYPSVQLTTTATSLTSEPYLVMIVFSTKTVRIKNS